MQRSMLAASAVLFAASAAMAANPQFVPIDGRDVHETSAPGEIINFTPSVHQGGTGIGTGAADAAPSTGGDAIKGSSGKPNNPHLKPENWKPVTNKMKAAGKQLDTADYTCYTQ